MRIIPIGIYGPYMAAGHATSCYLIEEGDTKVALDFGSGSLSLIQKHIDPRKLDAIILTHLHFDHFCDILPFAYMAGDGFKVYCPASPTDNFSIIKNRKNYDIGVIDRAGRITIGDIMFEFEEMTHPVESYAVKATGKCGSFVYTGDTSDYSRLIEFSKGCRFIICDCMSAPGTPHLTLEQGTALQKATGIQVIGTHINPGYDGAAEAKKLGLRVVNANEILDADFGNIDNK